MGSTRSSLPRTTRPSSSPSIAGLADEQLLHVGLDRLDVGLQLSARIANLLLQLPVRLVVVPDLPLQKPQREGEQGRR